MRNICTDQRIDRDPEAEAEEKVEEEKVPGAEEAVAAPADTGFAATGGDWEAAPAGFAAASGGNWDGQAADEWGTAAAPAAPTGEWGAAEAKESQW